MGSFANSLHVKSDNAAKVVAAVRNLLFADGYEITDEELPQEALWGMPSSLRGIHVSEASEGWVSVLDSDLMQSLSLTAALSGELESDAIQVMVNDSDSWHYQLYRRGEHVDEFDSSGGEGFVDDEGTARMLGSMGGGSIEDVQALMERVRQMQEQMQQKMPPEIRDIMQRLQTGRATPDETLKYSQWMGAETPRLMESFKDLMGNFSPGLGGFSPGLDAHLGRSADRDDVLTHLQPHLEQLRPLLKSGVDDEQVLKALGAQAVFAEDLLQQFLPLLGIHPFYAALSYRYLGDFSPQDQESHEIRLVEHLKFKKSNGSGQGRLRIVR
ncbi:MAG TPA: hypothetical protein VH643_40375 [Gemmataceae bacterium]|jgi:hypothetical protein